MLQLDVYEDWYFLIIVCGAELSESRTRDSNNYQDFSKKKILEV